MAEGMSLAALRQHSTTNPSWNNPTNPAVYNPTTGRWEANPNAVAATAQWATNAGQEQAASAARQAALPNPRLAQAGSQASLQRLMGGPAPASNVPDWRNPPEPDWYTRQVAETAAAARTPSAWSPVTYGAMSSTSAPPASAQPPSTNPLSDWDARNRAAQDRANELMERERMNAAADARRAEEMQNFIKANPPPAQVSRSGGASAAGEQAARDAAFARAKDRVGQITRGSLTALRENLAGRGLAGGGVERGGVASVVGGGQANLGEVARDQALSDVAQAQHVADLDYQGGISQRGQDLNRMQSLLSLWNSRGPVY